VKNKNSLKEEELDEENLANLSLEKCFESNSRKGLTGL